MGFLTDRQDTIIRYRHHKYQVNPAYDIVLRMQQMYEDERLGDLDKLNTALAMLVVRPKKICLSIDGKIGLLQAITNHCIKTPDRPIVGKQQKLFDFDHDGEYIYSSFLMDYGLDLMAMQGRLSWKKFIALFQGLSDKTKIKEVMRIRGMEIPAPTKSNKKEIQNILELKAYYALPTKGQNGQGGLDALFAMLERAAR